MNSSMKGVLQHKNFCLRYESMEYLEFLGGDFAQHSLRMQGFAHELYTEMYTAGIGGDTD